MSRENLCQICHAKHLTNKCFSKKIVSILQNKKLGVQDVASEAQINTERVRNWYYKDTGIVAYDAWLLVQRYDCIRQLFLYD